MSDYVKTKKFVRLTEDIMCENSLLSSQEKCFLPAGTEGVIIDEQTIGLIPNLSEQQYNEIVKCELIAKEIGAFLVLISGCLTAIHSTKLKIVRYDPPGPIFEDEADREQYLNEMFESFRKRALEDK